MDIPAQYSILHRVDNFSEYHTPRFYESADRKFNKKPVSFKSRQTYIQPIQKWAKQIPGPGKYSNNPEESKEKKKYVKKIDFQKLQKKSASTGKFTYLNQIPSVGKYNIQIDHTEQIRMKYKKKGDIDRKKAPIFRPTALQQINVDTAKISPGSYQVLKPLGYKSSFGSINPESKHKRSQSLPKLPSAFDYNPIPVSFQTFSRKQSVSNLQGRKKPQELNKSQNRKQTLGPGPKYSLIIDWVLKKGKNGTIKGQNYLSKISSPVQKSIYH